MTLLRLQHLALACLACTSIARAQHPATFQVQPTLNPNQLGSQFNAVTAFSPADVWAAGFQGGNADYINGDTTLVEHFDGTSWTVTPTPSHNQSNCLTPLHALTGISGAAPDDVWAVGLTNVNPNCTAEFSPLTLHWDGSIWSFVPTPPTRAGGNTQLNGVLALAHDNVYAVGSKNGPKDAVQTLVEQWDGTRWNVLNTPNGNPNGSYLNAISATSASDIWAVGAQAGPDVEVDTLALHFDGAQWQVIPSPNVAMGEPLDQNDLLSVAAISPNNAIAVGYVADSDTLTVTTLVERWDGTSWTVEPSPNVSTAFGSSNFFYSVAALSASNIYAFGSYSDGATAGQPRSFVAHFDGMSWRILQPPTPGASQLLIGSYALPAANSIWAVGGYSVPGYDTESRFLIRPRTLVIESSNP